MFLSLNVDVSNAGISKGIVGPGYWVHGVSGTSLQSKFTTYRSSYGHASTVDGGGEYVSGGWKPRYVMSNGSQYATSRGNKAYYNWK
ncbi:hypothetical protein RZE82_08670 [Mollicutes bacterium LVI A0039]|nr:hypothetical protein RZE82_08670 [Mollicutes bacterium LVI A0039]